MSLAVKGGGELCGVRHGNRSVDALLVGLLGHARMTCENQHQSKRSRSQQTIEPDAFHLMSPSG